MRPADALQTHRAEVLSLIADYRMANARLFGSVLTGEDTETSDLDLLVDAPPDIGFAFGELQERLEALLGVRVDLCTPQCLSARIRGRVLATARPLA
jgi:predicted nucleotidyltransferase